MDQTPSFETFTTSPMPSWSSELSFGKLRNPQESTIETAVSPSIFQKVVAELLGTYIFVLVGCASALAHRENPLSIEGTAMLWGLDLMVIKYMLGHISGAYINPATTIAYAVARRFPWKHVPVYILAHLTGSTLACLNLKALFHHQPDIKPALTLYSSSITPLQAVAWEYTITFVIILTSAGVATDHRAHKMLFGVAIGAAVVFNVIVAGDITGASMNPARSIGPAFVSGVYKDLWVYIVGPILGATTATLVYGVFRVSEPEKSKESTKIIYNELYTEPFHTTTQLEKTKSITTVNNDLYTEPFCKTARFGKTKNITTTYNELYTEPFYETV